MWQPFIQTMNSLHMRLLLPSVIIIGHKCKNRRL